MKLTALRFERLVEDALGEPLRAAGFVPKPSTCTRNRIARQVWRDGDRFVAVHAVPQLLMDPPQVGVTLGMGPTEPPFDGRRDVSVRVLTERFDAPRLPDCSVETVQTELDRLRAELLEVGADFLNGDLDAFRLRMREAWATWLAMRETRSRSLD